MTIPKLRSPIVLVHGLLGYDQIQVYGWTVARYFRNIPELLRAAGNRVLIPRLSPTGGIAERAAQLKDFLERESPGEPVHLFGHSMGGLDCRYLISRLDMAPRILSLTTIGTPHRGTVFADWGVYHLERVLKPFFDRLAVPSQAFYDLTTESCRKFNETVPNMPGVRYFSVAGRMEGLWDHLHWQLPHRIVHGAEGPNDGVVSVASASHGESTEVWDGDHISLVNWPNPATFSRGAWRDRTPRYAALVRRLADEGF